MADGVVPETVLHTQVEVVKARLKIDNFAATCASSPTFTRGEAKLGECVSEPLFYAQSIPFALKVEWGIRSDGGLDYESEVGLFAMCLVEEPKTLRLCHRLHLTLINSNPEETIEMSDVHWGKWDAACIGWTVSDRDGALLKLGELLEESNGFLHNGAVLIEVKLEFVPKVAMLTLRTSAAKVKNGQPALGNSFKALLTSGDMADVVITVAEERLNAHSLILCARSQVFRMMLTSPMREGLEKEVTIPDISAEVMKALLEYLYTGNIERSLDDDDFCSGLLHASHRFEIKELFQECEEVMASRLSLSTAASWFELADLLSCQNLRPACLRFIQQNAAAVQGTEGFERLVERRPALLKDILAAVTPPKPPAKRRKR